jgi:hypothetical protein
MIFQIKRVAFWAARFFYGQIKSKPKSAVTKAGLPFGVINFIMLL